MQKQWLWLLLFITTIVVVVSGWYWYHGQSPATIVARSQPTTLTEFPSVEPSRLLADVEALSFTRYTTADRRRARDYIVSALEAAGWKVDQQSLDDGTHQGINLVTMRPGTDSTAGTILLAAHYDTVEPSPGADDNATSVATVLEAARLLGAYPTPQTLQLALFDLEEVGLVGSTAFAEALTGNEPLRAIVLDMMGYACYVDGCQSFPPLPVTPETNRGDFIAAIGDRDHPELLDSLTQASVNGPPVLTLSIPTFGRLTPDLMRSDHVPFWRKGLGAVLITDTANFRNPHYHQPSDTFDTIDRNFFTGTAQRVINATLALLLS
ncbi:M28 family peptidase [Thermocoleostomius sinensis]|uniref:M28 family peptidase n=1 Tax=Thermocoleostomius sinensis A174 TaxID=2016057 RepID=A0A9E8ZG76_9CYAN|nr:M28 family peptidase [Thermocoleostomius sinensis]WAL62211.1 M28 family peptidase [Thermocoleostomius sinensis A174]